MTMFNRQLGLTATREKLAAIATDETREMMFRVAAELQSKAQLGTPEDLTAMWEMVSNLASTLLALRVQRRYAAERPNEVQRVDIDGVFHSVKEK